SVSSRRGHRRLVSDWSSDVCSSDLYELYRARSAPFTLTSGRLRRGAEGAVQLVRTSPRPGQLGRVEAPAQVGLQRAALVGGPGRSEERRGGGGRGSRESEGEWMARR